MTDTDLTNEVPTQGGRGEDSTMIDNKHSTDGATNHFEGNQTGGGPSIQFSDGDFTAEESQHVRPHIAKAGLTSKTAHRDRRGGRRTHRRLVYKNGFYNVSHANIKKLRLSYLADIFTTMVDIKWRWNLFIFVLVFVLSWLIFALIWWLICFSHGDLENYGKEDWEPCLEEVYDFTTALLYSIETQHTIGYGSRATSPYCPEAILVMMVQACFGVILQALMTGIVFAKLSRSKKRANTLMFSKNAVICKRDGKFCLLIRLGDMRKSSIIDAHCRAILVKKRVTLEGEVIPLYHYDLCFGPEDNDGKLFLVWPVVLEHVITEDSPFWEMSPECFSREQFELLVILEGTVESTGSTTQARTSYLPNEILWGRSFEKLMTFRKENGEYKIDFSLFHSTLPVTIPHCSAKELQELQESMAEETDSDMRYLRNGSTSSSVSSISARDTVNSRTALMSCRSISTQTLDESNDTEGIRKRHKLNKSQNNNNSNSNIVDDTVEEYSDASEHL